MTELLEREAQVAAVEALLEGARAGEGAALVLEGPAGIGKSRLLQHARTLAAERGLRVLHARASPLEHDFAFGVVRGLFEPLLAGAEPAERQALLAGAARLADAVLDAEAAGEQRPDASYGVLHGLYWLLANATEDRAVLVVVDDVQWADPPSLRFLAYLAPRLDGLAAALLLGLRTGEEPADRQLLAAIVDGASTARLDLAPLSPDASAALAREVLGSEPSQSFARAVHDAAGGNALFVREVLLAARNAGLRGAAADAGALPALLGGASLARVVRRRLDLLPEPARRLAEAVAVAGPDADADAGAVAALAGMSAADAAAARDVLVRAEVLTAGSAPAFVHPVVAAGVLAGMAPGERASAHGRAASALAAAGAGPERRAIHLLEAPPAGDAAAVETLREAARRASAEFALETAVRLLERALAEPPPPELVGEVLFELGRARAPLAPVAAVDALERARDLLPPDHVDVVRELGRALYGAGRLAEAVAVLGEACDAMPADSELRALLEGELAFVARFDRRSYAQVAGRLARITTEPDPTTPAGAALLACLALEDGRAGIERERVLERARRVLASSGLSAASFEPPVIVTAQALVHADELPEAIAHFGDALRVARERGSAMQFAQASALRSAALLRAGDLAEAEADARASHAVAVDAIYAVRPQAAWALVQVLLERGELDEAVRVLDGVPADEVEAPVFASAWLREARGLLKAAAGRPREGLEDVLAAGELFTGLGVDNPGVTPWRSSAAAIALRLEQPELAARLAADELVAARRWGAPRAIARALRVQARVVGDADGQSLLEEAVAVLAGSPARLERAYAGAQLGALLRRANRRAEARPLLQDALELAERCGATPLAICAADELVASGARPRRVARTGVDALTPSEARVARLAAEGRTNREIAQELFVTPKTVTEHLTKAYRKLDIASRSQLARALD